MTAPGATCSRSRGDEGRDCWRSGTDEGASGETPGAESHGFSPPHPLPEVRMNCPSCKKEIVPDSVFCSWCSDFVPSSGKGKKANLFRRWVALALDPLIAVVLYLVGVGIVGSISKDLGIEIGRAHV